MVVSEPMGLSLLVRLLPDDRVELQAYREMLPPEDTSAPAARHKQAAEPARAEPPGRA